MIATAAPQGEALRASDIVEGQRPKPGVLVPGCCHALHHAGRVVQEAVVKLSRRERRDGRMHAVLRVQHLCRSHHADQVDIEFAREEYYKQRVTSACQQDVQ